MHFIHSSPHHKIIDTHHRVYPSLKLWFSFQFPSSFGKCQMCRETKTEYMDKMVKTQLIKADLWTFNMIISIEQFAHVKPAHKQLWEQVPKFTWDFIRELAKHLFLWQWLYLGGNSMCMFMHPFGTWNVWSHAFTCV